MFPSQFGLIEEGRRAHLHLGPRNQQKRVFFGLLHVRTPNAKLCGVSKAHSRRVRPKLQIYAFDVSAKRTGVVDPPCRQGLVVPSGDRGQEETPQSAVSTSTPSLPDLWPSLANTYGDALALVDPHASPPASYSFKQLALEISTFAAGLSSLGLAPGDRVSLFSENGARWLIADQGIMSCGAANAVRGVSSTPEELLYILEQSQSKGVVLQDAATLKKISEAIATHPGVAKAIRFVVVLWGDAVEGSNETTGISCPILTYDEVQRLGQAMPLSTSGSSEKILRHPQGLATLVYTSGTTGQPKSVALTHANILYQVAQFPAFLDVKPSQRTLSLLPPWHIYERTCAYFILSRGAAQVYTNVRKLRDDLTTYPPDHLVCVPLVLDSLHTRIVATLKKASLLRRALATFLLGAATASTRARRVIQGVDVRWAIRPRPFLELVKAWALFIVLSPFAWLAQKLVAVKVRRALGIRGCVVSGGGSLAPHLDDFYETIGIPVLNGWGLTETSPVLACRAAVDSGADGNVRGSVGRAIPGGTKIRVVDPETLVDMPDGQQGLLLAKGPGVMSGYDGAEAATAAAFPGGDGWFNTGDLGWRAPEGVPGSRMTGCIVLTGRAKDTIVLSNGENVEPQPIEDNLCRSPFIKFAMLVGQGHRSLGALLFPNTDALEEEAVARGKEVLSETEVESLMRQAVTDTNKERSSRWEQVVAFKIVNTPLSFEEGTLTRTMKPRRAVIMEAYAKDVEELDKKLR